MMRVCERRPAPRGAVVVHLTCVTALWVAGCASGADAREAPKAGDAAATADAIVDGHLDARGGEARLSALRVVERRGTMTVSLGDHGEVVGDYRTCVVYGEAGAVHIDAGPTQVARVFAGGEAWRCDAAWSGCRPADEETRSALARTVEEANRELVYQRAGWRDPNVVDARGEPVEVTAIVDGRAMRYAFDRSSGLLVTKSDAERRRTYRDWRDVDGVRFPFVIVDHARGARTAQIALDAVAVSRAPSEWCRSALSAARGLRR